MLSNRAVLACCALLFILCHPHVARAEEKIVFPISEMAQENEKLSALYEENKVYVDYTAEDVFLAYISILNKKDLRPHHPIYTRKTQNWQEEWEVTAAQMEKSLQHIQKCGAYELKEQGDYAVVRYPPESDRTCHPYFLVREDNAWRLDILLLMNSIKFNHENYWYFVSECPEPYKFAFADWQFNRDGYPFKKARLSSAK